MNGLQIFTKQVPVLDSREVAEMVGVQHKNLIRNIDHYTEVLSESSKLSPQNFFIERTYKAEGNNKSYKRYDITKQGCEMVANKLTGEKGILFTTVQYRTCYGKKPTSVNWRIEAESRLHRQDLIQ